MTISDPLAVAEQAIVSEHQLREKVINEEFKIWKKTVPLLYDTIHTLALEYPLLSTDFFPEYSISDDKNLITAKLAVGTNSSGKAQDHVHVIDVTLPSTLAPNFTDFAIGESIPIPSNMSKNAMKISSLWKHPGEVNCLKVSPDGSKIATFDKEGAIHVYSEGEDADQKLSYHTAEGYCLEWVTNQQFLSGANDNKIALWDLTSKNGPIKKFNSHRAVINDISYSIPSKNLFGSAADDYTVQIHDIRAPEESPAIKFTQKYIQNAIQFHPEVTTLFATAGKDNLVTLYDARNVKEPLRKFYGHNDSVIGLKWGSVSDFNLLHSWGLDKRVLTWDLTQLGEEFVPSAIDTSDSRRRLKQNGDPCLQFIHGGHTKRVNDVALHPKIPSLFATVGDECLLEVYKPKVILENSDALEDSDDRGEDSDKDKDKMDEEEDDDDENDENDHNDIADNKHDDHDVDMDHDAEEDAVKDENATPKAEEEKNNYRQTNDTIKEEIRANTDVDMDKEEPPAES